MNLRPQVIAITGIAALFIGAYIATPRKPNYTLNNEQNNVSNNSEPIPKTDRKLTATENDDWRAMNELESITKRKEEVRSNTYDSEIKDMLSRTPSIKPGSDTYNEMTGYLRNALQNSPSGLREKMIKEFPKPIH